MTMDLQEQADQLYCDLEYNLDDDLMSMVKKLIDIELKLEQDKTEQKHCFECKKQVDNTKQSYTCSCGYEGLNW